MIISIAIDMESLTGFGEMCNPLPRVAVLIPLPQGDSVSSPGRALGYRALQTYGLHILATHMWRQKKTAVSEQRENLLALSSDSSFYKEK